MKLISKETVANTTNPIRKKLTLPYTSDSLPKNIIKEANGIRKESGTHITSESEREKALPTCGTTKERKPDVNVEINDAIEVLTRTIILNPPFK
jgi:hypothetical protein